MCSLGLGLKIEAGSLLCAMTPGRTEGQSFAKSHAGRLSD